MTNKHIELILGGYENALLVFLDEEIYNTPIEELIEYVDQYTINQYVNYNKPEYYEYALWDEFSIVLKELNAIYSRKIEQEIRSLNFQIDELFISELGTLTLALNFSSDGTLNCLVESGNGSISGGLHFSIEASYIQPKEMEILSKISNEISKRFSNNFFDYFISTDDNLKYDKKLYEFILKNVSRVHENNFILSNRIKEAVFKYNIAKGEFPLYIRQEPTRHPAMDIRKTLIILGEADGLLNYELVEGVKRYSGKISMENLIKDNNSLLPKSNRNYTLKAEDFY